MLDVNSLVLYKSRPGRVSQAGDKKIEIELEGGERLSVRPKDVTLLHPGPITNPAKLQALTGEIMTAWELLAGQETTLAELAELAYGEFTPATAWAAWQVVADGLIFSGTPEAITAHSPEAVAEEKAARALRVAEEQAWNAFLERAAAGRLEPEDKRYLAEVASLAWTEKENSRVLRALGQRESPENAHALLLKLGYWDETVNPYPRRAGLPIDPPSITLPDLPHEPRRDLTHLVALAIDDEGSRDPDDALSLEGGRLWVHIADPAAVITPDSPADLEARSRGANLYLPEGTVPMLPLQATEILALGLTEVSPALSFGLDLGPEGQIRGLEIVPSWVRVSRLTYEEAEERLGDEPFRSLYALARHFEARRRLNGAIWLDLPEVRIRLVDGRVTIRPLPPLRSRDLVREAMLMTGEAVGRYALEQGIPLPFTGQEGPETLPDLGPEAGLALMFAVRRTLRPSQAGSAPSPHAGLGLPLYVQATSPLRRYLDLVVHQQLRAHLRGEALLDNQAVMARVGAADAVTGSVRWAERRANEHWTLVYLMQQGSWQGQGIVVELRGSQATLLIPELGLESQIYLRRPPSLDSIVPLTLNKINLPELQAHFKGG